MGNILSRMNAAKPKAPPPCGRARTFLRQRRRSLLRPATRTVGCIFDDTCQRNSLRGDTWQGCRGPHGAWKSGYSRTTATDRKPAMCSVPNWGHAGAFIQYSYDGTAAGYGYSVLGWKGLT